MSQAYKCDKCKNACSRTSDLTRHQHNKISCVELTTKTTSDNKPKFIIMFKGCFDIVRDNAGLTGGKALRNLSSILIFKLIEPHSGNEIDIDNDNYTFCSY